VIGDVSLAALWLASQVAAPLFAVFSVIRLTLEATT
jgi:hypothetical protein